MSSVIRLSDTESVRRTGHAPEARRRPNGSGLSIRALSKSYTIDGAPLPVLKGINVEVLTRNQTASTRRNSSVDRR